ncbi:glycosyltransferase [Microbacterium sp. P02]|uniref:glycosyltransferase n=1 Tax=Microbacterium sp. P02 TaxID=3366260 RepID=UPI00366E006C
MSEVQIAIPYWGDPQLLIRAVDSVLQQDDDRWRLVVIDDCYPDSTVREYMATIRDGRVSYVRNDENIGITANFRKAVALADADYVCVMGSDDLLLPGYVAVILAAASAHPDADIIQPGVRVVDADGVASRPLADRVKAVLAPRGAGPTTLQGELLAASLLRGNWLYWPSLAFKTSTIRRFDFRDDLAVIQDLAILIDIAFAEGTLVYTPRDAFLYRRHDASASQSALTDGTRFADERRYYDEARRGAQSRGWDRAARAARWRVMSRLHALTELPRAVRSGHRGAVRACLDHVFR